MPRAELCPRSAAGLRNASLIRSRSPVSRSRSCWVTVMPGLRSSRARSADPPACRTYPWRCSRRSWTTRADTTARRPCGSARRRSLFVQLSAGRFVIGRIGRGLLAAEGVLGVARRVLDVLTGLLEVRLALLGLALVLHLLVADGLARG